MYIYSMLLGSLKVQMTLFETMFRNIQDQRKLESHTEHRRINLKLLINSKLTS